MKSTHWSVLFLFLGGLLGFAAGGGRIQQYATGQTRSVAPAAPAAHSSPRFQMATWGDAHMHGCYILDAVTGELWDSSAGNVVKVTDKLPQSVVDRRAGSAKETP
jgi:hypothetical protein